MSAEMTRAKAPAPEVTTAEKIRLLPWNTALNATNSVFAQLTFFGSAFILFLDELNASNAQIGLLLSMLPFFGVIALFIAPWVARFGYKRTYVTFFGIRKIIAACLLLTPWVMMNFGANAAMTLVTLIMIGFALCRSISEVGLYPWAQEYVPNSIRGKHGALNDMVSRVTGMAAVAVGGVILGLSTGLDRFMLLFAVALVFGVAAVWSAAHLPGGVPRVGKAMGYRDFLHALRDKNFAVYLAGLCLSAFAVAPISFLPVFMQKQIGLSDSAVLWLQIGSIAGGFSATYLFGWAADRYGSKPVILSALYARTLLPLGWLLMPRMSEWSLPIALLIAVLWGIVEIAWLLGSGRLLFTSVVPENRKGEYLALFYASIGLIGGISQIFSGNLLDATATLSGQVLMIPIDPFTPLFIISMVLSAASSLMFRRVRPDSDVSVSDFANLFTHGNPFGGLQTVMRYYRAKDERSMVMATEQMGQTKSPLTVDELLEALEDPRFNVRFEAVISIARMGPDPHLVAALCHILDEGTELSVSVIAAWALGRMGDHSAVPTLRRGLDSPWRSIQAHCARALGTLCDLDCGAMFLERLQREPDKGLRMAYAAALGNLQYAPALEALFEMLRTTANEGARMELSLSVARIAHAERHFIRLRRALVHDTGTTAAQAILALNRQVGHSLSTEPVAQCAYTFATHDLHAGAVLLASLAEELAPPDDDTPTAQIFRECAHALRQFKGERLEWILLPMALFQEMEK